MIYNEQKLASFSRTSFKYETQKIIDTHHDIRDAINQHYDKAKVKQDFGLGNLPVLDVYLQGSYKNSTDVTKSSDVDLVVQMSTIWRANKESLPADQLVKYDSSYVDVHFPVSQFKSDIQNALNQFFDPQFVSNGNKCLKITEHGKYCSADVIPCFSYRQYGFFESNTNQKYTEGMFFYANNGDFIRNFPKQHYDALTTKSTNTNGAFKETVRMFKNIKDDLIDNHVISKDIVSSYFIENLLYNVPITYFSGTYTDRFRSIVNHLCDQYSSGNVNGFTCANGIDQLISEENWRIEDLRLYLIALTKVRDETQF